MKRNLSSCYVSGNTCTMDKESKLSQPHTSNHDIDNDNGSSIEDHTETVEVPYRIEINNDITKTCDRYGIADDQVDSDNASPQVFDENMYTDTAENTDCKRRSGGSVGDINVNCRTCNSSTVNVGCNDRAYLTCADAGIHNITHEHGHLPCPSHLSGVDKQPSGCGLHVNYCDRHPYVNDEHSSTNDGQACIVGLHSESNRVKLNGGGLQCNVGDVLTAVKCVQPNVIGGEISEGDVLPSVVHVQPNVIEGKLSEGDVLPSDAHMQQNVIGGDLSDGDKLPSDAHVQRKLCDSQLTGDDFQLNGSNVQPSVDVAQPNIGEMLPTDGGVQPNLDVLQPSVGAVQLGVNDSQPTVGGVQPNLDVLQPSVGAVQLGVNDVQPTDGGVQPNLDVLQPSVGAVQLGVNDVQPTDGEVRRNVSNVMPCDFVRHIQALAESNYQRDKAKSMLEKSNVPVKHFDTVDDRVHASILTREKQSVESCLLKTDYSQENLRLQFTESAGVSQCLKDDMPNTLCESNIHIKTEEVSDTRKCMIVDRMKQIVPLQTVNVNDNGVPFVQNEPKSVDNKEMGEFNCKSEVIVDGATGEVDVQQRKIVPCTAQNIELGYLSTQTYCATNDSQEDLYVDLDNILADNEHVENKAPCDEKNVVKVANNSYMLPKVKPKFSINIAQMRLPSGATGVDVAPQDHVREAGLIGVDVAPQDHVREAAVRNCLPKDLGTVEEQVETNIACRKQSGNHENGQTVDIGCVTHEGDNCETEEVVHCGNLSGMFAVNTADRRLTVDSGNTLCDSGFIEMFSNSVLARSVNRMSFEHKNGAQKDTSLQRTMELTNTDQRSDSTINDTHSGLNINSLHFPILLKIFKHFSVFELLRVIPRVCKYWYTVTIDPELWTRITLANQHRVTDKAVFRVSKLMFIHYYK